MNNLKFPTRFWLRAFAMLGLVAVLAPLGKAQTTLFTEGFEGVFPAAPWVVGDSNLTSGLAYWDDKDSAFGTIAAHTGSWKGYCAGIGFVGPTTTPRYTNNMQAYMRRTINLAGFNGANLDFWYAIPSIETCCDRLSVFMDGTMIWTTNTAQSGWQRVNLPLNSFVGATRTLRFEFLADASVIFEGAYLDDITVHAANGPFGSTLLSLIDANYSGYVLASDYLLGRSNIQAQATFQVENFTGTNAMYTNVLSFRLINASNGTAHPIYSFGNVTTNAGYTYNVTNIVSLLAGTNATFTTNAYLRPAAWMNQFTQYYIECRRLTNGVLAQVLTTTPQTYYHFTNTLSGDAAYNVLLNMTDNDWSRIYAIETIPAQDSFRVNVDYEVRRWDDLDVAIASHNIPVVFNYTLRDQAGAVVPLAQSSQTVYDLIPSYDIFFFAFPYFTTISRDLDIRPSGQLDSVNKTYYLTVTISHTNNPVAGQVLVANTLQTTTNQLMHFNGNLIFGPIGTTMTDLGVPPTLNPPVAGVVPTSLNLVDGYVTGSPGHTYANGGPLSASLNPVGDAIVTGGSVVLTPPSFPDDDVVARVRFRRGPITLSAAGASANIIVTLPAGFGYRLNDTATDILQSKISFTSVALNALLNPASDLTYLPGALIFAAEESKPAWLQCDRILWRVSAGRFDLNPVGVQTRYVRAEEYAYLQSVSNNLVEPSMADKRSNEKYWLELAALGAPPSVRADANSNAVMNTAFQFNPGGFRAHFPYDVRVEWGGPGSMQVSDDLVVAGTASFLDGAKPVGVRYTRDCPDCGGAGAGFAAPIINSSNGVFSFTRDGGLVAGGPTTAPVDLQWGAIGAPINDFAQQALNFNEAAFHMPGAFLRGSENLLASVHGATTILYTGFAVSNLNVIERPLSVGYSRGYADYAGMNFRCLTDGAHQGQSTIAGLPGIQWELTGRSKYYVRYAGVSGIHESVLGTFPNTLTLWGYDFTFTSYGLSYLDTENKESRTDGAIYLPDPSDFTQGFDNMKFTCLGAPLNAELPQGDGFKVMDYWIADFKTLAIQFKSNNGCDPSEGYLVLGIEGYASHVDKPLYGAVGFFNNGDHIPRSFGLEGVDSRLRLPNVIKIAGANKTTYYFTPVANAYYNTHAGSPPAPEAGWMNIFGKVDVPFFEDLQLHWQTSCHTNGVAASNAPVFLSGGWPRPGSGNPNFGWMINSRTPFETNHFDWPNRGWPGPGGGLTIDNYRDNTSAEDYHPRAQRLWLGVVDMDYPLSWNRTQRSFKSWKQTEDDLLVLHVQHEVKYMDAKQAELVFGAQYDGLPSISIANLAFNAIDEATGVGSAIVQAAAQPVFDVLTTGLDELNQLLDTQMQRMMDGVFDRTVDPIIDDLYNTLSNQWQNWYSIPVAQRQQFIASLETNLANILIGDGLAPVANNLSGALRDLGSVVNEANNIIGQVQTFLGNASNAIASVVGVISVGTNGLPLGSNVVGLISKVSGDRPIAPKLVESLVGEFAPQFIDAVVGPILADVLAEIEPALTTITEVLNQTKDTIALVEGQLESAGNFTQEIDNTIKSFSSQMTNVAMQVSMSLTQYFGQLNYNLDNPFQHITAQDVKNFARQKVEDYFFSTDAAAQVQTIMRQRLYDLDAGMREQVDSVFQELNNVMRSLISQSLAEIDNTINKALGDISDVMGAGQINGHALIVGDSLKLLRLDAHFEWKAPDSMEFNAFLQIKELDSDGTPGCSSPSGTFTEVTLGATDVSLDWISPDLSIDVSTKFTFDGTIPFPVNFAGNLELDGTISFEAFELYGLAAGLAFGKYENYLALKGGVRFNSYDFSGAIFFGRTCTLDPIYLIDPDVADVLGNPPFTGVYVYAQGWLPISEIVLGIPASCFFNISAGVGAGAFVFVEGPTFGGKMFLGVSAELLCIVTIQGDITMIGVKSGDDLRFKGTGHFEAEVGPCPFCITVSKDISITYIDESWSIDY